MAEEVKYPWTDNCCVSGVAPCNTDILNDCLMHLKYDEKDISNDGIEIRNIIKSCKCDSSGNPDLFTINEENATKTIAWHRPNLTSNGTVGGNSYAAFSSGAVSSDREAWKAFNVDNSYASGTANFWLSPNNANIHWCGFYSPIPFKCTGVTIRNGGEDINKYVSTAGRIEASNDNTNWTVEATYSNNNTNNGAYWTVNLTNPIYAKYRRIVSTKGTYSNYVLFANIQFDNATQQVQVIAGNTAELNVSEVNPLEIIVPDGRTVKLTNTTTVSLEGRAAGKYPLFIDESGVVYVADGYYAQKTKPAGLNAEKLYFWLNTSSYPNRLYKLSAGEEIEIQAVHIATAIMEQNLIESLENVGIPNTSVMNDFLTRGISAAKSSMPSGRLINLTLGASGSYYTMPADGWLNILVSNTTTDGSIGMYYNRVNLAQQTNSSIGNQMSLLAPVQKGQVVQIAYRNIESLYFGFIYAEGAK